jgi:hypothetical protein
LHPICEQLSRHIRHRPVSCQRINETKSRLE